MIQARDSYKVIKAKYDAIARAKAKKKNPNASPEALKKVKSNVRLTQSSLILIQEIDATTNVYKFAILENDNAFPPQPEEIRLNQNDEFVAYEVGYYLVADYEAGLIVGKEFFTYAPIELDSNFLGVAKAYNGVMKIEVNNINRLEKWDLKKHNVKPRTQFGSAGAVIPQASQPSIRFDVDGVYAMQPMLTLSGSKKSLIQIDLLGGAIPAGTTGTFTSEDAGAIVYEINWLALTFRGMLGQNSAVFQ